MPKVVQEKFQVNYPDADNAQGNVWKTDKSARVKKNSPGREGLPGGDYDSRYMNNALETLSLPPGMDMEDQEYTDQREFNHSVNGNFPIGHHAGDLTNHELNATSLRKGFDKKPLLQTDDMYTREHQDAFYDDVGGFIERNNYLDRS
jgi:hypothetical protein